MKYLLAIYNNPGNWEALPEAERAGMMGEHIAYTKEIVDSSEFVDGAPLADQHVARRVRVRAGETDVLDGPFAESKEYLAGYYLVDVDSPERATELAVKCPSARFATVEVRRLLDVGGQEM